MTPPRPRPTQEVDRALARRLRAIRGRFGYSQQQVAMALSLHRESITEIEQGRRAVKATEFARLASLYRMTMDELMAGVGRATRDPGQPAARLRLSPSINSQQRSAR